MKPQNISVTKLERRALGQYSEVKVIALGMAPPKPMPVMKRNTTKVVISGENADSKLAKPNTNTEPIKMGLRPILSAKGPKISAPAIKPNKPAPNKGAKCVASNCHASFNAGAIKPTAAVSKPSIATTKKHSAMMSFCVRDKGCASMNCCTSMRDACTSVFFISFSLAALCHHNLSFLMRVLRLCSLNLGRKKRANSLIALALGRTSGL